MAIEREDVEIRVKKVKRLMMELQVEGEFVHHALSGRTTEGAERALGVSRGKILKCLLFRSGDRFVAAIVTGERRVDVRKLERVSGFRQLRLARAKEVKQFTGFDVGGIPPFVFHGLCPVFVDTNVMKQEFVVGAAGTEYAGVKFSPKELEKIGYLVNDIT